MKVLKTACVFTNKMIIGQAKRLQNVHKIATRNEAMSKNARERNTRKAIICRPEGA